MKIILFDGVCNLCCTATGIIIKYDNCNNFYFASLQSNAGKELIHKYQIDSELDSVVFINDGGLFYQSDAIIEISKLLTGWPRFFRYGSILPKSFRDLLYRFIAGHRYLVFGKKAICMLPKEGDTWRFL